MKKHTVSPVSKGLKTALYAAGFLAIVLLLSWLQWFAWNDQQKINFSNMIKPAAVPAFLRLYSMAHLQL